MSQFLIDVLGIVVIGGLVALIYIAVLSSLPGEVAMIDLSEPMFDLCGNPNIRRGYCAMVVDDQLVYAGPIPDCPEVTEGAELFLHPKDVATLNAWFKKHQH